MKRRTKAAFIRLYPKATPETLAKLASTKGLHITPQYVRNIRRDDATAETKKFPKPKLAKTAPKLVKMSDINTDPAFNQRAQPETSDIRKVSGGGLVRAFKAMVIAIGTRTAHQLVNDVEDETAKLFGRPPL